MKKLSKPIVAVLVTLISSILACLVLAVWVITSPQEQIAPSRDFVVSFEAGTCGEEKYPNAGTFQTTYPTKAYPSGTPITLPKTDPTWAEGDTDHTFMGWKSDVSTHDTLYKAEAEYTVTADVVFTAQWAKTEVSNGNVGKDEVKDGYLQVDTTAANEVKSALSSAIEGATVSESDDSKIEVDVTEIKKVIEQAEAENKAPTRTGYNNSGYQIVDSNSNVTKIEGDTVTLDKNATEYTIEPIWEAIQYGVTLSTDHDQKGAQGTAPTISLDDEGVYILPMLSEAGYTFKGWQVGVTGNLALSEATAKGDGTGYTFQLTQEFIKEAETAMSGAAAARARAALYAAAAEADPTFIFTAVWQENGATTTYTVNFSAPEADETWSAQPWKGAEGAQIALPTAPTRTGYTFEGWVLDASDGSETPLTEATALTAELISKYFTGGKTEVTLTAKWSPIDYTIKFTENGHGTAPDDITLNLETTKSATVPTIENVTGYTLEEWTLEGVDSLKPNASINFDKNFITTYFGDETTITFTASWTAINYTITFNEGTHSGNTAKATNMPTGGTLTLDDSSPSITLKKPEVVGYSFTGWQYETGSGTIAAEETTFTLTAEIIGTHADGTDTITLTATWSAIEYTIAFSDGDHKNADDIKDMPTDDSLTLESGTSITLTTPTITGYNFTGWQYKTGSGTIAKAESAFTLTAEIITAHADSTDTITLTATWESIKYTVKYSAGSGVTLNSGNVPTDTATYALDGTTSISVKSMTATRKGYDFKGWYLGTDEANPHTAGTLSLTEILKTSTNIKVEGDENIITLTAKWSAIIYTAVYAHTPALEADILPDDIAKMPSAQTFSLDDATITLGTPTRAGYTFAYWTIGSSTTHYTTSSTPFTSAMIPSSVTRNEITITAHWTVEQKGWYFGSSVTNWSSFSQMKKLTVHSNGTYTLTYDLTAGDTFKMMYRTATQGDSVTSSYAWDTYAFGSWGSGDINKYFHYKNNEDNALVIFTGEYTFTINSTTRTTAANNIKVQLNINNEKQQIYSATIEDQINAGTICLNMWVDDGDLISGLSTSNNQNWFTLTTYDHYYSTSANISKTGRIFCTKSSNIYTIRFAANEADLGKVQMGLSNSTHTWYTTNNVTFTKTSAKVYLYSGHGLSIVQ